MLEKLRALVEEAREGNLTLDEFTQAARREFIVQTLQSKRGNQVQAAREIGVHRNTLSRMMAEHQIDPRCAKRVRSAQKVPLKEFRRA